MYYRSIKIKNGGDEVEFRHFGTLVGAYTWLIPSEEQYEKERWNFKSFPDILALCKLWNERGCNMEVVGWNETEVESTVYIQQVTGWQDSLPKF